MASLDQPLPLDPSVLSAMAGQAAPSAQPAIDPSVLTKGRDADMLLQQLVQQLPGVAQLQQQLRQMLAHYVSQAASGSSGAPPAMPQSPAPAGMGVPSMHGAY